VQRATSEKLPTVIASSVVRSSYQGESHGGVYIVDLQTGDTEQVIDWNDKSISWEGRGLDRGLRGIALYQDLVYVSASDEVLVYTKDFELIGSIRNRYLEHCHETHVSDGKLYLTSTGFDSILEYDLVSNTFTRGYCLRFGKLARLHSRLRSRRSEPLRHLPRLYIFDPALDGGPVPGDTCHLNNVFRRGEVLLVSGTGLGHVLAVDGSGLSNYARVPYGSHNARPFGEGVLLNDTACDSVSYLSLYGERIESFPVKRYDENTLSNTFLPEDHARQAFARGLCVTDDGLIIGGSSPATISAYTHNGALQTVNLSMDVRNAIHGLELWP
jgi:hypothetical protein